ncbi:MAG: AtpZ/AtpI family protein [Longimicrobiales bacterium]|nr:AtpZ/AtpI family protein [Longimicrobiales bacterium]
MCPSDSEDPGRREEFESTLSGKANRKLRAREEGDRGIWFGLGMMGLVGWAVAIPTVAGLAVGIWLDRRSPDPGGISWTLTGLVVGVFVGCLNAWFWIQRELEGRP